MVNSEITANPNSTTSSVVASMKKVTFRRGDHVILDDITFHIDEGIFLGLIGPNGGGKTTLLKLMLGLLPLQEGQIEIFQRVPTDLESHRWLIGYVPQRHEVDKNFPASTLDVVLMGAIGKAGLFRRIPAKSRQRAEQMLERVGLAELRDRPIGRMSGGQQQRAFIARALVSEPRLLVLDEPTSGLDSSGQHQFLHMVRELQRDLRLTVIMVSHDVGQLSHYSDQIACLNRRLHWHDKAELLEDHVIQHVYTCELDAYAGLVREIE